MSIDEVAAVIDLLLEQRIAEIERAHRERLVEIRRAEQNNLNPLALRSKETSAELDRIHACLGARIDTFFEAWQRSGDLPPAPAIDDLGRRVESECRVREATVVDQLRHSTTTSGQQYPAAVEAQFHRSCSSHLAEAQRSIAGRAAEARLTLNRKEARRDRPKLVLELVSVGVAVITAAFVLAGPVRTVGVLVGVAFVLGGAWIRSRAVAVRVVVLIGALFAALYSVGFLGVRSAPPAPPRIGHRSRAQPFPGQASGTAEPTTAKEPTTIEVLRHRTRPTAGSRLPIVTQRSLGAQSPNIAGNGNSVIFQNSTDRALTDEQRKRLVDVLSRKGGHEIIVASHFGNGESIHFAEQLISAFRDAGWRPEQNLMSVNAFPGVSLVAGLSRGGELEGADVVREAFRAANLELVDPRVADVRTDAIGALRGGTMILVVGRKPD
jgi:hypothetical protein